MQATQLKKVVRKYYLKKLMIWGFLLIGISINVYPLIEYGESLLIEAKDIHSYGMELFAKRIPPITTAQDMNFISTGYEIHNGDKAGKNYKESTIYLGEIEGKYIICIYPSNENSDPMYLAGKDKVLLIKEMSKLIDYENVLVGVIGDLNSIYNENVTEDDFINKVIYLEQEDKLLEGKIIAIGMIIGVFFMLYQMIRCVLGMLGLPKLRGRCYINEKRWKPIALKIEEDEVKKVGKEYRITEHWLVGILQGVIVLPTDLVVWIYQEGHYIYIYTKDGKKYTLRNWSKKRIHKMYEDMKVALPWVYKEYTKDLKLTWKKQRIGMIEEVAERKLDHDLSDWL